MALLSACGGGDDGDVPQAPTFSEPRLQQGRTTWMQVCRNCHLTGVAGAPAIDDHPAWRPRRAQGREALYRSALEGIPGENGWTMPPKGGNPSLSDTQVRQAVDYMLAAERELAGDTSP